MQVREMELIGLDAPLNPQEEADAYIAQLRRWWPPPRGVRQRKTRRGVEVHYIYQGAPCKVLIGGPDVVKKKRGVEV